LLLKPPMQFIRTLVERDYAEYAFVFEEGSQSFALVQSVIALGVKIIYFILLLIGLFTVWFWIFFIVWLCTKKPLRKLFNKDYDGTGKYRVRFVSRLGGFGIGVAKGLVYVFLIGLILAGVASMAKSAEEIIPSQEVAVVCVDNTFTVVELTSNTESVEELEASEQDVLFDALQAYRETFAGKIFGAVKFGENETTFDEFMFDSIFSINTEHGNVKLRKELRNLAKILSSETVKSVMTDGFDISKLYQLESEDLKQLIDLLTELDIIKVVVPVGIEFIAYSESLVEKFGSSFATIQELIQSKYNELVELDYCSEIKNLGYVFVDVLDLLGEDLDNPKNIDFLSLDQQTINKIFESLNGLELLEIIAPVTINYLLNTDTVKEIVFKTGFTMEDLGLTGDIDYVQELMNLPKIYEKLTEIGMKFVEGKLDLSAVDYTKVSGFVEALFDSMIVQNAVPVVGTSLINTYLPEDFLGIFTKEEVENIDWEKEFSPVITAALVLLNSGILEAENKIEALTQLDKQKIEDLGEYISQSELFTNNLNEVIESLLKTVLHDSISYNGLDESKGEVWNKDEIIALFNVMKKLASGISFTLSDEEYEDLAVALNSSTYVRKNLNNIIGALTADLGVTINGLEYEEWTINEIFSAFKSVSIIMDTSGSGSITLEQMLNLDDDKLNVILESKLMRETLITFVQEKAQPGQSLELLKGVYVDGVDENGQKVYTWEDTLVDVDSTVSGGTLTITNNPGVVQYNIYKNGRYFLSTIDNLVVNLTTESYNYNSNDEFTVKGITSKGEIRKVFTAISKLEFENVQAFNIDLRNVMQNKETLLESYILTSTLIDQLIRLDKSNGGQIAIPEELKDANSSLWYGNYGELMDAFDAMDLVLNISSSDTPVYINTLSEKMNTLDFDNISNNKDEILKSKIIALTIIDVIRELNGNGLCIPEQYMSNDSLWYSEYNDSNVLIKHKELGNLLESLLLVVDSESLSNLNDLNVYDIFDSVISVFNDEAQVKKLLSSTIFNETIKDNILKSDSINSYINVSFNRYGKNSNSSSEWYSFDSNGVPQRKELWNLMKGLSIILGNDSFDSINDFTIEMIVENNNMIPVYDSQYNVVSSNVGELLKSIIFEEIFANVVQEMCAEGGYLALVINIPSDVNWYRKDVSGSEEYDLQSFIESFFLIQSALDFENIKNIEESGSSLKQLSQSEVQSLATGMVCSRIFKGSIATMFNLIFSAEFAKIAVDDRYSMSEKIELATWWQNNLFVQSDYNGTKADARAKFISKFNAICSKLK